MFAMACWLVMDFANRASSSDCFVSLLALRKIVSGYEMIILRVFAVLLLLHDFRSVALCSAQFLSGSVARAS